MNIVRTHTDPEGRQYQVIDFGKQIGLYDLFLRSQKGNDIHWKGKVQSTGGQPYPEEFSSAGVDHAALEQAYQAAQPPKPIASKDSAAVAKASRTVAFMPLMGEKEVKQETVQLTVVPQVGPEPWDLHVLEGQGPKSGRAGKITIGTPSYPSAALSWIEQNGEPIVHNIWVEEDVRRHGAARVLVDAFRRHVSPKVTFIGPYSEAGLASAQKLSDEVRAKSTTWYKAARAHEQQ